MASNFKWTFVGSFFLTLGTNAAAQIPCPNSAYYQQGNNSAVVSLMMVNRTNYPSNTLGLYVIDPTSNVGSPVPSLGASLNPQQNTTLSQDANSPTPLPGEISANFSPSCPVLCQQGKDAIIRLGLALTPAPSNNPFSGVYIEATVKPESVSKNATACTLVLSGLTVESTDSHNKNYNKFITVTNQGDQGTVVINQPPS